MEMSPKSLDYLMIGKYGKRKINSFMEIFTNNQGVVTDAEGLSDVVKEMYWDQWLKEYGALTKAYDPIAPSFNEKTTEQEDTRNISEVTDQDQTATSTSNVETNSTGSTTSQGTSTTTENITDSGSDSNTSSSTDTVDGTQVLSGTDSTTDTGSVTGTDTTRVNLSNDEGLGISHVIESDHVTGQGTSESLRNTSVAPYDTANLKGTNGVSDSVETNNESDRSLTESTLEKSVTANTNSVSKSDTQAIQYGKQTDTDQTETLQSNSTISYGKVSDSESLHTDNNSTANTAEVTNESTSSASSTNDKTVNTEDTFTRTATETERGNKWWQTPQELINQELELRRKNVYDRIVKDVVGLLTLSLYSMEEV